MDFEDELATSILSTLHQHLGLVIATTSIPDPEGGEMAWIRAEAPDGQVYKVRGGTAYEAACALAELVGFDLTAE